MKFDGDGEVWMGTVRCDACKRLGALCPDCNGFKVAFERAYPDHTLEHKDAYNKTWWIVPVPSGEMISKLHALVKALHDMSQDGVLGTGDVDPDGRKFRLTMSQRVPTMDNTGVFNDAQYIRLQRVRSRLQDGDLYRRAIGMPALKNRVVRDDKSWSPPALEQPEAGA